MKRPGFTIAEMLIYISIVSIALVVFMNFLIDINRASERSRVAKEVDQNGRTVINRIVQDVRTANSITVDNTSNPNTLKINGTTTYTTSSGSVVVGTTPPLTPLTNPSVNVTDLKFEPAGSSVTITLSLEGRVGTPANQQKTLTLNSTVEPHKLLY